MKLLPMYRAVRYPNGMATGKKATSFRLSPEALRMLAALAKQLGLSQASVIEMAIRDLSRRG